MTDGNARPAVSRRRFLRAAGGVGGLAATTGAASGAQSGGGSTVTVDVVNFAFEPEELTIPPGTTVEFVWQSDGHNIVVESQPDGANWGGTEGGPSDLYDTGHTHTHTFSTTGTYDYYCDPHRSMGMVGTIVVKEGASLPGQSEGPTSILPDSAKTIGVATTGAMTAVLGLAYFFLKYGGDYGEPVE